MLSFIRTHKTAVGASSIVVLAGLAWLAFGFFGVHTLFIDDVVSEATPTFDVPAVEAEPVAINEPATPADTPADTRATEAPDSADTGGTDPAAPAADDSAVEPAEPAPETTADETTDVVDPTPTTVPVPEPGEIVTEVSGSFRSEAHPTSGTASVLGNGTGQRFLRFEDFQSDNGPDLNVYLFDDDTGDFIDLGDLKGNIGEQNYEIPEDVDLNRFDRVSIWCVRFGVGFGSAELMAS